MNIKNFLQMARGGNPQQMLLEMLSKQSANNPMMANLYGLAKNNDAKGFESFARNMMQERGLDFDAEFEKFKKTYHL